MTGLIVILFTGGETTQLAAMVAMILTILSFFWRLFPIIKSLDNNGLITPSGYSKTLGLMIIGFISLFVIALLWWFIQS